MQTNTRLAYAVLSLIVIVLCVVLWTTVQKNSGQNLVGMQNTSVLKEPSPICARYGYDKYADEELPQYTVKRGDTILTVAKIQLKDVSRVQELISLNNHLYPELSLEKPFLEVGWVLLLPPVEIAKTKGNIRIASGLITGVSADGNVWTMKSADGNTEYSFYPKQYSGTIIKTRVESGVCVDILYEYNDPSTVYMVSLQS